MRDAEETCGHTVLDADGIEEPCGLPVSGWRYYEGYEHEDMLQPVCADHEQAALGEAIRARDAEVAEQARAEVDRIALNLSTMTTLGESDARHIAEVAATLAGFEWPSTHECPRGCDACATEREMLNGCERCVYGSGFMVDGGACPCWVTLRKCCPDCDCVGA